MPPLSRPLSYADLIGLISMLALALDHRLAAVVIFAVAVILDGKPKREAPDAAAE